MDELDECIASSYSIENEFFKNELSGAVSTFLRTVSERDCNIFIRRYFYLQSVEEIAAFYKIKESNVFMNLSRTRKKLRNHLRKEGYLE